MNHPAIMKKALVIVPSMAVVELQAFDWLDYERQARENAPKSAKWFFFIWLDDKPQAVKVLYLNVKATADVRYQFIKAGFVVHKIF